MFYRFIDAEKLPLNAVVYVLKEGTNFAVPTKIGVPFFDDNVITVSVDRRVFGFRENQKVIRFVYKNSLEQNMLFRFLGIRKENRGPVITLPDNEHLARKICESINKIAKNSNKKVDALYVFSKYRKGFGFSQLRIDEEVCELIHMRKEEIFDLITMIEYNINCNCIKKYPYILTRENGLLLCVSKSNYSINIMFTVRVLISVSTLFNADVCYDTVCFHGVCYNICDFLFCTTEQTKNLKIIGGF